LGGAQHPSDETEKEAAVLDSAGPVNNGREKYRIERLVFEGHMHGWLECEAHCP